MFKKSEKGQAIIMIVFAMIGLIGLTALTVDGGMAYSDRRHAQNAADTAAFAAALAHARGEDPLVAAQNVATSNGYSSNVVVTPVNSPVGVCPANTSPVAANQNVNNVDYTVEITSTIKTFFAPVIGIPSVTNKVFSTTRACGTYMAPLFGGNAIVSLNPGPGCAYDSGNANWVIHGGGLHSNSCMDTGPSGSVTVDGVDKCAGAVDGVTGNISPVCVSPPVAYNYPADVPMPPTPPCDGTPEGGVVVVPPGNPQPASLTFSNGLYCVDDFDNFSGKAIILNNATLYIRDLVWTVDVTGGSDGFSGTAMTSGTYKGYYLIAAMNPTACLEYTDPATNMQKIKFRGNTSAGIVGTIMMPSACIDWRGNSSGDMHTKIVGYTVTANGSVTGDITYLEDEQAKDPVYPLIQLLK